jgi:hypothetical protein
MKNFRIQQDSEAFSFFKKLFEAVEGDVEADSPTAQLPEADESIKKIKLDRKVTVEEIVEKINSIRAGRSLSNKNIRMQLEVYFSDLDEDEKLSLFAFLSGIAQIVTGEILGKIATEPDDVSYHETIQAKISEEEELASPDVEPKASIAEPQPQDVEMPISPVNK